MSNLFSFARFGQLFTKFTAEHWKSYLLGAGVLAGSLLLVMGLLSLPLPYPPSPGTQAGFFFFFLLGAGFLFTSSIFADFGEKSQAIAALMLPASHLEKYAVAWLYSFLLFLSAYVGIFFLVDGLILTFAEKNGTPGKMLDLFAADGWLDNALIAFLIVHSVALYGAIYFQKLAFIKTAAILFLLALGIVLINFQAVQSLLSVDLKMGLPFGGAEFVDQQSRYNLELPDAQKLWLILVPVALALLLWLAAYARLREKQV